MAGSLGLSMYLLGSTLSSEVGQSPDIVASGMAEGRAETVQVDPTGVSSEEPGEIVVTARRRAERIQDVPIAAQALSGEAMQAYNLQTAADLARVVPSLSFSGSFETIPKITIRGVGTNEFTANVNPAVGLYIDDVYQGLGAGQNFQLFDIERVEVLRGPQGTFVGKNSTGGAVQYYTSDPTDVLAGRVELGYGRFDRLETEAMINLPLGDGVAFRLSGTTTDRDGYWRNRLLGSRDGRIDRWALRGKLKLDLGENVSVLLKMAHGEADDDLRRSRQTGRLPSGADLTGYVADPAYYQGRADRQTYDRIKTTNASARVVAEMGDVTLTSVTGYDKVTRRSFEETDQNPFDLLTIFYPSNGRSFSQELRLSGETGDLTFVVGGYYGKERQRNGIDLRFFDCFVAQTCSVPSNAADLRAIAAAFGVPTDGLTDDQVEAILPPALNAGLAQQASRYDFSYRLRTTTYAGFAEGTYALTDKVNVTAGMRYTWERRSYFGRSLVTGGGALGPGFGSGGIPAADDAKSWDDLSGRVIVDYKPVPDVMLYASASRAFRAGNYNGGAFGSLDQALPPVDPESVWSYELGLKSQFFDRRVTFNLAGFRIDFSNKQEFIADNAQILLRNAASARTYGVEADIKWLPTDQLTLIAGVAVLDAKYRSFVSDLGDFTGNRLPNAPKLSLNGTVSYRIPLSSNVDATIAVDVQHRSRVHYQSNNDPITSENGYTTADLRLGVDVGDRLTINGFVNNLFNEKYIVDSNDIGVPFFITILTENMPRTWGVSASYRF